MRLVLVVALILPVRTAMGDDAPKKMETDKPMATRMMKPGMKQRDVKREADKKARDMQPRLEREGKSMGKAR